jgi:hypothetical protein
MPAGTQLITPYFPGFAPRKCLSYYKVVKFVFLNSLFLMDVIMNHENETKLIVIKRKYVHKSDTHSIRGRLKYRLMRMRRFDA